MTDLLGIGGGQALGSHVYKNWLLNNSYFCPSVMLEICDLPPQPTYNTVLLRHKIFLSQPYPTKKLVKSLRCSLYICTQMQAACLQIYNK